MRFPWDPDAVRLGLGSWYLLLVVFAVVPWLAARSRKRLAEVRSARARATEPVATPASPDAPVAAAPASSPSRLGVYASTAVLEAALLFVSLAVIAGWGVAALTPPRLGVTDGLIGLAALALGLSTLAFPRVGRWIRNGRPSAVAARTPGEWAGFAALVAIASVSEEVTYRGATFMILAAVTGSWWLAATLSALAFGGAHLAQGPRAASLVVLYGLRDQIVVGLTGTLYVAIAVHFVHDMVTGAVVARRGRMEG